MNVVKQVILTVGNNTIFSAFKNKNYKTDSLMFNNSIAYSIDIQRYDSEARNTISLCKLDLDAEDTVFDTTVLNTLDITAEWGTASSTNSISTEVFVLNKTY